MAKGAMIAAMMGASLAGCAAEGASDVADADPVAQGADAVVVGAGVVQVRPDDVAEAVIGVDAMTFFEPNERLMRMGPGTLVMGVLGGEPFIRRVRSVDFAVDGSLYVATDNAALADVAPTARARKTVKSPPLQVDLFGQPIWRDKDSLLLCIQCSARMEPALDYQLDLRPGAPEQFGLAVRGKLDGDFKLALEAPQGGVQWRREMELGKVSQRLVQSLGPVPVWEDVSLSLVAGIEGRVDSAVSMVVDIHVEEDASFGVFRQDGKWKVEKDINDGQLVFERPVFQASVNASAQAYVKVRLAVSLYSVVQTFLDAEARTAARMLFTPKPLPVSWVGSMGIQAGAKILWPGGGGPEMAFDLYRLEEATPIPPDSSVVVSWNGSQGRTTVLRASEP